MVTASHAPPFVPWPPFDNPAANLILRSSDGIDFSPSSSVSYYRWLRPSSLCEYLAEDPVAVFVIAYHHEWKDLVLEVARSSLRLSIRTFESVPDRLPQLKYITGDAYHKLLYYHAEYGQVAKLASSSLRWTLGHNFSGSGCGNTTSMCPMDHADWESATSDSDSITPWLAAYLKNATGPRYTDPVDRRNYNYNKFSGHYATYSGQ
ncbi:hypothetical protein DFH09DRAFT_1371802 [Mycena vulgaris]|nr:hypothetical protein DFH09DRAFT_1371802 [Mycena vulgaris]